MSAQTLRDEWQSTLSRSQEHFERPRFTRAERLAAFDWLRAQAENEHHAAVLAVELSAALMVIRAVRDWSLDCLNPKPEGRQQ